MMNANVRLILMGLVAAGAVAGTVYLYSTTWVFDAQQQECRTNSGKQAIAACSGVIASGKADREELTEAYKLRGDRYAQAKDYDRAIADYDSALQQDPGNWMALLERGSLYIDLRQYPRAIRDLDKAIALKPTTVTYNNRCWARAVWGRELDAALKDCNQSLKLKSDYDAALDSRALVYYRMGKYDKAVGDASEAISINLELPSSFYVRGLARIRLGNRKDANADIAQAKKLDPKIAETYAGYGVTP